MSGAGDPRALLRAVRARRRALEPPYLAELFPQQRAFVDDVAREKTALCSRRAGKTWAAVSSLLLAAERSAGVLCVYIALTRASAKKLAFEELERVNGRHSLGLTFNRSDLTVTLPNGSQILVVGANDAAVIERLRGLRLAIAIIDEAASFRPSILDRLVREIIRPALIDLQGTLALIGTPGPVCSGYFYDITSTPTANGYVLHHWTILDNPHIPHAAAELDRERRINRWDDKHPKYLREWKGEWATDLGSLIYPYDKTKNWTSALPFYTPDSWHRVVGIDYGTTSATAVTVLAWNDHEPTVYVVESSKREGLIPSDAAQWVREIITRYDPDRIVGDVGGLGKGYAEEARRRFGIPVQPAQKRDKLSYQDLMAGDLRSGLIKVVGASSTELVEEWQALQWATDKASDKSEARHEPDGVPNHCADATLYSWREAKAFTYEPVDEGPVEGSPEWAQAEQRRMFEAAKTRSAAAKAQQDAMTWYGDDDYEVI